MTDLKHIIDRIQQGGLHGEEIAEYRSTIATVLYWYYEEKGKLEAEQALWCAANRKDYKSQAECERAFDAREEGQTLIKRKNLIKGLEHLQEVLTSQWFALHKELKMS